LILVGGWFLIQQYYPGLLPDINFQYSWPWLVIGLGGLLLLFGLLVGSPGLAVPASVVGGIGCILYFQNLSGNWASWAYAWTLIPAFFGVGVLISGLLEGNLRRSLGSGVSLIVLSLVLFIIFASILGGPNLLGSYWPVLLILLGAWLLIRGIVRR
jgi:hypothetical protein